ncbi:unnamed protein product, partial [Rotaria sp. Silwood1]
RLSMQDKAYKQMNSHQNYLQPQRSLSSSRTSSMYGSHAYEFKQFTTPQIFDACDELLNSAKSPNDS